MNFEKYPRSVLSSVSHIPTTAPVFPRASQEVWVLASHLPHWIPQTESLPNCYQRPSAALPWPLQALAVAFLAFPHLSHTHLLVSLSPWTAGGLNEELHPVFFYGLEAADGRLGPSPRLGVGLLGLSPGAEITGFRGKNCHPPFLSSSPPPHPGSLVLAPA